MRVLLAMLLFVVLSGCGSPEPVAEPVAEKKSEPQPVARKAEAQPAAAHPEQPKNNPAPDAAGAQQAPVKAPANPQPAQPPVAEKPQQPVAPNRAPGKVPLLVSVRTKAGKKHVGELIERTDAGLVVYDIVLRDTVSITKDQMLSFVEGIDERTASSHVPFATYAAWKLTKLLRNGTVQGQIALVSDQGIFINLGSEHGLVAGQSVTLTGKAEVIKDPESGEELAVYRPPLAQLKILAVVNERLSKLSITASDKPVTIERGMTVTCDRGTTTIVVLPPTWNSENPDLKTGDEALYLTEHVLAELVRFGVAVISRDQVDQVTVELSQKTGKPAAAIPAATIGQSLKAGVLVTGQILAKGQIGNVTLHVTNLSNRQYVGIVVGKIRRDKIREASEKAKKAGNKIKNLRFQKLDHVALARVLGVTPEMSRSLLLAMPFDSKSVRVADGSIRVSDVSGRSRHATGMSEAVVTRGDGVRGECISCNGGNGLLFPGRLIHGRREFTISLWTRGGHSDDYLIGEYEQPRGTVEFSKPIFYFTGDPESLTVGAWNRRRPLITGDDYWIRVTSSRSNEGHDSWAFLAVRVSGATSNGGRIQVTSGSGTTTHRFQRVLDDRDGSRWSFCHLGNKFTGDVDEYLVFDRALSDEEIDLLARRGTAMPARK